MWAASILIQNTETFASLITKFSLTYNNQLSPKDRRLLAVLQRRVGCLVGPLNFCLQQSERVCEDNPQDEQLVGKINSICKPSVQSAVELLAEVQSFLAQLPQSGVSRDAKAGSGVKKYANVLNANQITEDLEFYCQELDSVTQALQLSLQVKHIHKE